MKVFRSITPRHRGIAYVHSIAEQGFQNASLYEASRPTYPTDVVDEMRSLLPRTQAPLRILELGAGTGLFTDLLVRDLLPSDGHLTAVEPSQGFRKVLANKFRDDGRVRVLDSSSQNLIQLEDASVDACIVAQAFHWMVLRFVPRLFLWLSFQLSP